MSRQKTTPNKAESKLIGITLNEHKALIESVMWDGEGEEFAFTIRTLDGAEYSNADLQEAVAEALEHVVEAEPEAAEEQAEADETETTKGRTIVPPHYRKEYAARGDARSNGDWFAITFRSLCNGNDKKSTVNLNKVYAIAKANGIEKEWPGLNSGQQRMNAGNMLRRKVVSTGVLIVPAGINGDEQLSLSASEWAAEVRAREAAKKAAKA